MSFTLKDSGTREYFASGMRRDTQDGKILYRLVFDGPMLERWAEQLTKGAAKYDPANWLKASGEEELQRFLDSAARHFVQWMRGDRDEDHAAALFFNINGAEYVRGRMAVPDQPAADFEAAPITLQPCGCIAYPGEEDYVTRLCSKHKLGGKGA